MELLEILKIVIPAAGVIAAIYNIFSSRTIVQEQGQKAKVEEALSLGRENKKDIAHVREQMAIQKEATNERLDQIGKDLGFVKDLLVKWILDPVKRNP